MSDLTTDPASEAADPDVAHVLEILEGLKKEGASVDVDLLRTLLRRERRELDVSTVLKRLYQNAD
jgi:hypothetical protein